MDATNERGEGFSSDEEVEDDVALSISKIKDLVDEVWK
jgi:hypothetical protein